MLAWYGKIVDISENYNVTLTFFIQKQVDMMVPLKRKQEMKIKSSPDIS